MESLPCTLLHIGQYGIWKADRQAHCVPTSTDNLVETITAAVCHILLSLPPPLALQVAAGGTHSLAVTSTGRMFIWGRASYGRLGLGSGGKDCYSPVEAALPGGHERWKIAAATAGTAVDSLGTCDYLSLC